MQIDEMERRLKRLEDAVFGADMRPMARSIYEVNQLPGMWMEVKRALDPLVDKHTGGDRLVLNAVISRKSASSSLQVNWLSQLMKEQNDAILARFASTLASRQRIGLVRRLIGTSLASGELVAETEMAGGHLHHHLRDLLHLGLVIKDDQGKYTTSEMGIKVYMTFAALYKQVNTVPAHPGVHSDMGIMHSHEGSVSRK